MEQEDYIKRQIDQLGRVLGKILAGLLGLKSQGSAGDVAAELTLELEDVLPLNGGDQASMPDDLFLEMIKDERKFGEENLGKLAEILHLLGEEYSRPGLAGKKGKNFYEKALRVYEYIDKTGKTYSFDRHLKIEAVKHALKEVT